jgi:hypothetical protein
MTEAEELMLQIRDLTLENDRLQNRLDQMMVAVDGVLDRVTHGCPIINLEWHEALMNLQSVTYPEVDTRCLLPPWQLHAAIL